MIHSVGAPLSVFVVGEAAARLHWHGIHVALVRCGQLPDHTIVIVVGLSTIHYSVASFTAKVIGLGLHGGVGVASGLIAVNTAVVLSAAIIVRQSQVLKRQIDLLGAHTHFKRSHVAIDVGNTTSLALEITLNDQHNLVEVPVLRDPVLVGERWHVTRAFVAHQLVARDGHVAALLSEDTI